MRLGGVNQAARSISGTVERCAASAAATRARRCCSPASPGRSRPRRPRRARPCGSCTSPRPSGRYGPQGCEAGLFGELALGGALSRSSSAVTSPLGMDQTARVVCARRTARRGGRARPRGLLARAVPHGLLRRDPRLPARAGGTSAGRRSRPWASGLPLQPSAGHRRARRSPAGYRRRRRPHVAASSVWVQHHRVVVVPECRARRRKPRPSITRRERSLWGTVSAMISVRPRSSARHPSRRREISVA